MAVKTVPKQRHYITGIDGFRTIAVLGVIAYHLLPAFLPGGFLGVPIFFGLTGYLVTDSFLNQIHQGNAFSVGQFYRHRLKRLSPALFAMLISTSAYITVFARPLLAGLRATIITNVLYVYNWFEISHGQSYFDRFNGESPFTHLWTLSIEGQFYLIWPFVIWGLVKWLKQRARIASTLAGLAVLSMILMAVLYHGDASVNRVYYGSDTRAFSLFLGAALATIWPSRQLNPHLKVGGRRLLNWIGGISLVVMVLMYWLISGTDAITYRGGMALFSVLTTFMIAVIVHPGASWNRWLTNPVFTWIGKRSYGIYLYQFPVMVFYEQRVVNVAAHPVLNSLVELILILIVTELSYRFIEQPLAGRSWSINWRQLQRKIRQPMQWLNQPAKLGTIGVMLVLTLLTLAGFVQASSRVNGAKNAQAKQIDAAGKRADVRNRKVAKEKAALNASRKQSRQTDAAADKQLNPAQKQTATKFGLTPAMMLAAQQTSVTAIGDSVLVDNADNLQQVFGHAYVDAKVGRQVWQAPAVIADLKKRQLLAPNVLINLGTNSPLTQGQVDDVLKAIGPKRRVFWVNTVVPTKNWQNQVNDLIKFNADRSKQVYLVDWYGLSHNQPSWFGEDHVHPNPTGSLAYTKLVVQTIVNQH